jgi:putative ABC transport system substrate-binding protein
MPHLYVPDYLRPVVRPAEAMGRRELVMLLGGAMLSWPLTARAQQRLTSVIGVLAPNPKVFETLTVERDLAALGWQAEHNLRLLFRVSAGTNEALPALAADLFAQNVDLIIAAGDQAVIAAQRASAAIPIVGICDDMVGSHLVASMARPGGNTTGISILASELDVKRLQLLHELVPQAARIGILADPTTISTRPQLEAAAPVLGIELITTLAANRDEISTALDHLAGAGLGAVNVLASPILDDARAVIIGRLNRLHLPAIYQWPELAELGGFAGYGPRLAGVIHAAMQIVDKILRGAHPTDIPVQQPTKFELVINLKTAKAIGLTVPQSILARADEVIE